MKVDRRRYTRTLVDWPATCAAIDLAAIDVRIVDASIGGFCIDCAVPLEVGASLTLAIHQIGTFPCRIAWKSETQAGVELSSEQGQPSDLEMGELATVLGSKTTR